MMILYYGCIGILGNLIEIKTLTIKQIGHQQALCPLFLTGPPWRRKWPGVWYWSLEEASLWPTPARYHSNLVYKKHAFDINLIRWLQLPWS